MIREDGRNGFRSMTVQQSNKVRGSSVQKQGPLSQAIEWIVTHNVHVILGALVVLAVAFQQNFSDITKARFHPDESRWLNRAIYTEKIFDPFGSTWEDRYLTRGQPPGGSYITGIGLLLQGRDLDSNGPWEFTRGGETVTWWNAAAGNMPAWDDLEAARRTSAFLGTVSAVALFFIVRRMSNVFGGVAAGLFFAIHPLSIYLSTLGVSDAAFTFLTAMSTLAAMRLARTRSWPIAILLGLLLGAGTATKLTPFLIAFALAGLGVVFALTPYARRIEFLSRAVDFIPGLSTLHARELSWKLISLPIVTCLTFFVTYPFLWPSPINRTQNLFDFRQAEMSSQTRIWPQSAVSSRFNALERTWQMLENRYSSTGKLFAEIARVSGRDISERGIDVPLAMAGLAIALVLVWKRGLSSPTFLGLTVAGLQAAIIVGGLTIDFDRYYLPIVFIFAIGVGVLAGTAASVLHRVAIRFGLPELPLPSPMPANAD